MHNDEDCYGTARGLKSDKFWMGRNIEVADWEKAVNDCFVKRLPAEKSGANYRSDIGFINQTGFNTSSGGAGGSGESRRNGGGRSGNNSEIRSCHQTVRLKESTSTDFCQFAGRTGKSYTYASQGFVKVVTCLETGTSPLDL